MLVHVFARVYKYIHADTCVYISTCVWRQQVNVWYFPQLLSTLITVHLVS